MSKETRCRREHSDLLRICAVMGVCLMLAMPLMDLDIPIGDDSNAAPGPATATVDVVFDLNGGVGGPGTVTYEYTVESYTYISSGYAPSEVPTCEGYTFFGWSEIRDGMSLFDSGGS